MARKTTKSTPKKEVAQPETKQKGEVKSVIFARPPKVNVSSVVLRHNYVVAFQCWANNSGEPQRAMMHKLLEMFLEQNIELIARDVDKIRHQVITQFEDLDPENFTWEAAFLLCLMAQPVKFTDEHIKIAIQAVEDGDPYAITREEFVNSLHDMPVPFVGGLKPLLSRVSDEKTTLD